MRCRRVRVAIGMRLWNSFQWSRYVIPVPAIREHRRKTGSNLNVTRASSFLDRLHRLGLFILSFYPQSRYTSNKKHIRTESIAKAALPEAKRCVDQKNGRRTTSAITYAQGTLIHSTVQKKQNRNAPLRDSNKASMLDFVR